MREHLESLYLNMDEIRTNITSKLSIAEKLNLELLQPIISDFDPIHRVQLSPERKRKRISHAEIQMNDLIREIESLIGQLKEAVEKYKEMRREAPGIFIMVRSTINFENLINIEAPNRNDMKTL